MVRMFKSFKRELWEVEEIEHFVSCMGYVTLSNVGILRYDDVVGIQAFAEGCYLGKTVLLQPISVHYDKWGLPFYRLKRYTESTRKSAYEKNQIYRSSWNGY